MVQREKERPKKAGSGARDLVPFSVLHAVPFLETLKIEFGIFTAVWFSNDVQRI